MSTEKDRFVKTRQFSYDEMVFEMREKRNVDCP